MVFTPLRVTVVSYNVLAPKLVKADEMPRCAREHLGEAFRFALIQKHLDSYVGRSAIICLQEVSRDWSAKLHCYFAARNYQFTYALSGGAFSDFMGVALAYPTHTGLTLSNLTFRTVGATIPPPPKEVPPPTPSRTVRVARLLRRAADGAVRVPIDVLRRLLGRPPLAIEAPPRVKTALETWKGACQRHNVVICATFATAAGASFCVANYHMPCEFEDAGFMASHAAAAAGVAAREAAGAPLVFAGDFNLTPGAAALGMLTSGEATAAAAAVGAEPLRAFVIETMGRVGPLRSAYDPLPKATNRSFVSRWGRDNDFTDTLDYIFLRDSAAATWEVAATDPALGDAEIAGDYLPNAVHPSDHVPVAADLVLRPKA